MDDRAEDVVEHQLHLICVGGARLMRVEHLLGGIATDKFVQYMRHRFLIRVSIAYKPIS